MPGLVLGPLVRHIGERDATVWVETDAACEVDVLGRTARTFHVEGHHYAIVVVDGLEPGTTYEYGVALDGERLWPQAESDAPPSTIRTLDPTRGTKLLFGSCRVSFPHEPPYTLPPEEHDCGHGLDALYAYALRMHEEPAERWPDAILLLGDQVYADEVSPRTLEFIRSRRSTDEPPGEEVADFEEYTRLYHEAWQDPVVRWFLSTVSSAMLFDDHDVHDDWNISRAWVERMRATSWWDERIVGAFMSYWIYQHLGNLSPRELAEDELLPRVLEAEDAGPILREFAFRADREAAGTRWSFHRDFGGTRLLAIDCRAGRVLEEDHRRMVDEEEWEWIVEHARGDFDHLLLGMSDPWLLAPGMHDAQAWNEALCGGAWGSAFATLSERIREGVDLDHWASFGTSFDMLTDLLRRVGSGELGEAPASVVALSGDVHNAYLAETAFRRGSGVTSRIYQAVCSPLRNPLAPAERRAQRFGTSKAGTLVGRALAAAAGVEQPEIRWRNVRGPWFENQVATLEIEGREALLRLEKAVPGEGRPRLTTVFEHRLA